MPKNKDLKTEETVPGETAPDTVSEPVHKKKKKGKKKHKKGTKNSSETTSTSPQKATKATKQETQATTPKIKARALERELASEAFPSHVSSWEILPNPLDENAGNILTFYADDEPVTYLEINPGNLSPILEALNEELFTPGQEVTSWHLRVPESPDLPPLLTLVSNGTVLATLPLEKDTLKHLVPKLNKLYNPNRPSWGKFVKWVKNHKIASGILFIPFIGVVLYSLSTFIR